MPKLGQLGRIPDSIHTIREMGMKLKGQRMQHVAKRAHLHDFDLDKMYLDIDHAPQFLNYMNDKYPEEDLSDLFDYLTTVRNYPRPRKFVIDDAVQAESEIAFKAVLQKEKEGILKQAAARLVEPEYETVEDILDQRKILNHIDEENDKRHLAPKSAFKVGNLQGRDKEMEYSEVAAEFGFHYNTVAKRSAVAERARIQAKKPLPAHKAAISNSGLVMYIDSADFEVFITNLMQLTSEQLGQHYICLSCWQYIDLNQKLQHQRMMHISPEQDAITDRDSFLHYAKIFNRYHKTTGLVHTLKAYSSIQINRIMFVQPTNEKGMKGIKMKRNPLENRMHLDNIKGMPPLMQEPLVPLDMVPFNDQEMIEIPPVNPKELRFGWQTIKRRPNKKQPLTKMFRDDEQAQMLEVLKGFQSELDSLEQSLRTLKIELSLIDALDTSGIDPDDQKTHKSDRVIPKTPLQIRLEGLLCVELPTIYRKTQISEQRDSCQSQSSRKHSQNSWTEPKKAKVELVLNSNGFLRAMTTDQLAGTDVGAMTTEKPVVQPKKAGKRNKTNEPRQSLYSDATLTESSFVASEVGTENGNDLEKLMKDIMKETLKTQMMQYVQ